MRAYLKDPNSAEYEWGSVGKGWARHAPIDGGRLVFGYRLEAQINARNSFGGYTGFKPYIFMYYDGELKNIWGQRELRSGSMSQAYMGRLK